MDPVEKFERLIDEARSAASEDLQRIGRLIVDDPDDAREAPDPEAVRRWYTETPCQMMLGDGPGSPTERSCGTTPTVGGNGLYRYCERHMQMAVRAGATTLQRDADADLQIDDNGDLVASTLASIDRVLAEERPGSIRAIACRVLTGMSLDEFQRASAQLRAEASVEAPPRNAMTWPREGFAAGGSYVVGDAVSTPTGRFQCNAIGTARVGPPGSIHDPARRANLLVHGSKALDLYGERPADAVAWLDERIRSQRYGDSTWNRYSCRKCEATLSLGIRTDDELVVAVKLHEGACSMEADVPIGKAPQCGHLALTVGCSTCTILRDHLARVGVDRAARILTAEMGALGPADADGLRRQFGLPTPASPPVVHITNHYEFGPALTQAFEIAAEAGQNAMLNVIRGNPVRRRAEEIAADRATGYADHPYAERAAMLLCDEFNGTDDDAHLAEDGHDPTVEVAGFRPALSRPDGFSQAQVDAAKAVLLAPVAKRGGR